MDLAREQEEKSRIVGNFLSITGASAAQATEYLDRNNWDIQEAVDEYMADQESGDAGGSSEPAVPPGYTGPRTLDGRPVPEASRSGTRQAAAAKKPQKKTGLVTLSSLGGGSGHGHGHDHDEDEEDDSDEDYEDERGPRDLFAGGEKSGLAVQDPAHAGQGSRKLIHDIIAKAKQNASRAEPAEGSSSHFWGTGITLGGDGVPSRTIPDPRAGPAGGAAGGFPGASAVPSAPPQERTLHIWEDGFSIDDGPLHRFDDPQNEQDLRMIRQGRAPLHLMNVRYDQPVDVKLQQHREPWRQLPRIYRPFSGTGRRLGSAVPGESSPPPQPESAAPAPAVPAAPAAAATAAQSGPASGGGPTILLRIQLPDGTRLPARFAPTQTIGDVYGFVAASSPNLAGPSARSWVLATTFPNKDHVDKDAVLGEMTEFKRGGTAVVKYV